MASASVPARIKTNAQPECNHATEHKVHYQYSQIDITKGAIRLLILRAGTGPEIDCDLVDSTIDQHDLAYEAVSYTWGPEFASDSIKIRGRNLPVTFNLGLILRDLRSADMDRVIWVDAVCINQQDATEKGHQVAQMKDIFRSAKCVLFCICRPTEYTDLLMDSLERLHSLQDARPGENHAIEDTWREVQTAIAGQHMDPHQPHYEASLQKQVQALTLLLRQGLEYILNQPWFLRVWILQEVANAFSAVVYCGRKSISAATFALSPKLLNAEIPFGLNGVVAQVLSLMPGPSRTNASQHLYQLLQRFRGSLATVERDRIYALFGLCQDLHIDAYVHPNYTKSDKDVILDTISYICRVELSAIANSPFNSMSEFLRELDHLDTNLLAHVLEAGDYRSALSLLRYRATFLSVGLEILTLASTDRMMKEGVMTLLLEHHDADLLFSGWDGWYSTCVAAENGHDALAKSMLEKVTNIESIQGSDKGQTTRLMLAASKGITSLVRLLLEFGAVVEIKDSEGFSPLICAAKKGHANIVQLLIDSGVNISEIDNRARTAIYHAALEGHDAIVGLLLKEGANPLGSDISGVTPLQVAAKNGHDATIRLLFACDPYVNFHNCSDDSVVRRSLDAAASDAALFCHLSTLTLLFEAGADVDQKSLSYYLEHVLSQNPQCWSLEVASEKTHNQELLAQMLIQRGARSDKALCRAARAGNEAIVQLLIDQEGGEAAINNQFIHHVSGEIEATPLLLAIESGNANLVKLLLEKGANLEIRDFKGQTPLSWAAQKGQKDIAEILLDAGAEIDAKDDFQRTPLAIAGDWKCESVMELLMKRGANENVKGFRWRFEAPTHPLENTG